MPAKPPIILTTTAYLSPVFCPIIINMIKRHDHWVRFTAVNAFIAPIGFKGLIFHMLGCFAVVFSVFHGANLAGFDSGPCWLFTTPRTKPLLFAGGSAILVLPTPFFLTFCATNPSRPRWIIAVQTKPLLFVPLVPFAPRSQFARLAASTALTPSRSLPVEFF